MYYEKKKSNSLWFILIIFFLIIIISILINLINKIDININENMEETTLAGTDTVLNDFDIESLVKNTIYSVVGVSKFSTNNTSIFVENSEEKLGIGSGIIITSDGYILTNQSIAGERESTCYVTLKNGTVYPAEVVWINRNLDIAIIKISANNLLALSMGDSDNCSLGEEIYMISNPIGYNFNQNLQIGIISEINKTLKIVNEQSEIYVEDIMKMNNTISSEQTGSPILNIDGEVIGISSSKLNVIIPINRIKTIIEKYETNGDFEEAYLGVYGFDYDVIRYLNLGIDINSGVYIEKIEENSPAKEKIFSGDIITKIDNNEIRNMVELSNYLYTKIPGDKILLSVIRDAKQLEIEIELSKIRI